MPAILKIAVIAAVALTGLWSMQGNAVAPSTHATVTPAAIQTASGLAEYLQATPASESPLSLLPAGARKRFLNTLVWGRKGLGGFDVADLEQYLTDAQIHKVLALFDAQGYASGLHGRAESLTEAQRKAPETPLEKAFDSFYFAHAEATHGRHATAATTLYDRALAPYQHPPSLAGLDDSDLGLLFRAASVAASTSRDARYLDDLRLDLAELHERGIATRGQIVGVHATLVTARRFLDANTLAIAYPAAGIKPLPPLQQAPLVHDGSPTALTMAPDGKSMLRQPVDMWVPLRIVVVAGCHFSEDAARAIRANPQLDKLFHEHAAWLAPENESLPDVLQWNREFPDQPMLVAWRKDEWSTLGSWDIPTFYVFRNGKQVDQWSGWGPEGMDRLQKHLRRNGLLN